MNSEVALEPMVADLTASNAAELFEGIDLILDGTDNFETRYLINDAAVRAGIPWIYGAAVGSYGMKLAIVPGRTACFRCIYPESSARARSPTCETAGVLGPVTATIAALQVADALKILVAADADVGLDRALITTVDVWSGEIRQMDPPDARSRLPLLRAPRIRVSGRLAPRADQPVRPQRRADSRAGAAYRFSRSGARLGAMAPVRANEFALRVALDPYELTVFPDGRAIIKGTTDIGLARSLYARYVGA